MISIKITLIALIVMLIIRYYKGLKNNLILRFSFVLLFFTGILFVSFPSYLTLIANFFGIGRGTDLLVYIIVITFYFGFIKLYSKERKTDIKMTRIIRQIAKKNGKILNTSNEE